MNKPIKNPPTEQKLRFAVLATDIVLFTLNPENQLLIRLVTVDRPPYFNNIPGLPGGLIEPKETAEMAVRRHLTEKSLINTEKTYIEQLYTFSDIDRDPRGRVVAVAYIAFIPWDTMTSDEQTGDKNTYWQTVGKIPHLAYDHDQIVALALKRLQTKISYTTAIKELLPKEFTLTELEQAYETILSRDIDKRNFRKKIEKLQLLKELPRKREGTRWRPAKLYQFRSNQVLEANILYS